jgi:chromosome segregation ATPase
MSRNSAARAIYAEQKEEAPVEQQVAVLQADVSHIKSDIAEMKIDIRELRGDMTVATEAISKLRTDVVTQGAELRKETGDVWDELKSEIGALRMEMRVGFEKLRGSQRLIIATNTIGQLVTAGIILGVVGRALKWF